MKQELISYRVSQLVPYINWIYYLHAWGISPRFAGAASVHGCPACRSAWVHSFPEEQQSQAEEAMKLCCDSLALLREVEGQVEVKAAFRLCRAGSQGDDLWLDGVRIPLLRQQSPRSGEPCLCLSDFVRPLSSTAADISNAADDAGVVDDAGRFDVASTVGIFATSVHCTQEELFRADPYRHLLLQTLTDRLAEAAVECTHRYVRRSAWGYAPDEELPIPDLLNERFQGIRPAVGYPSLPDQSVIFLFNQLLPLHEVGITLTESGAMHPHASTCGLMFGHPASRYFSVGKIDEEQLRDYAHRRGLPEAVMRRFLSANL